MYALYQSGKNERLRPTTGIFNAVINSWARSREEIAPCRAEQILEWMSKLHQAGNLNIQPDKYTFNTVIHAWAKSGGLTAAEKAEKLLLKMHALHEGGNEQAKPDTITVRCLDVTIILLSTQLFLTLYKVQCCHQRMGQKWGEIISERSRKAASQDAQLS